MISQTSDDLDTEKQKQEEEEIRDATISEDRRRPHHGQRPLLRSLGPFPLWQEGQAQGPKKDKPKRQETTKLGLNLLMSLTESDLV